MDYRRLFLPVRASWTSWLLAGQRRAFEAFIEQVLTPTLRPGDLVVMNNLSSHKGVRTPALIHAA